MVDIQIFWKLSNLNNILNINKLSAFFHFCLVTLISQLINILMCFYELNLKSKKKKKNVINKSHLKS